MAERRELDNGLVIEDLEEGDGPECAPGGSVSVNYRGTLEDGTEFDSNWYDPPVSFSLARLIEAWQIGIPGMRVGGVRRLTVPPELGYGDAGSPPVIPPRATLIFDIKLVGVG